MSETSIQKVDTRKNIVCPGGLQETIRYASEYIIQVANECIEKKGSFSIAISGGSTPGPLYQELTKAQNRQRLDWKKAWLFWVDERAVGPADEESNFRNALDNGFSATDIPTTQLFRMVAENNIEKNAQAYDQFLTTELKNEPIDIIILGMGPDGHTASLFPNTQALNETKRKVVANEVPQKKCSRMTMTLPFLNQAKNLMFLVTGKDKSEMLNEVLSDKQGKYPAARIGSANNPALFIVDDGAIMKYQKSKAA